MTNDNSNSNTRRKKYVSRACDACKKRKSRCDGRNPCSRCLEAGLSCSYELEGRRAQKRAHLKKVDVAAPVDNSHASLASIRTSRSTSRDPSPSSIPTPAEAHNPSAHAFLQRVYNHLSTMGQITPRSLLQPAETILSHRSDLDLFRLPEKQIARDYMNCYFTHCNATYRYISRPETFKLLDRIYSDDQVVLNDDAIVGKILMLVSLGCVWYASWRGTDFAKQKSQATRLHYTGKARLDKLKSQFPPTITQLQALTAECQLLLALNHFNTAWISLGYTVRLAQMIGLHQRQRNLSDAENYMRGMLFWSIFMIDRYLSVVVGRPMAINNSDITIQYPSEKFTDFEYLYGSQEMKLVPGAIAHIKLTRIIGEAMSKLYNNTKYDTASRNQMVNELEQMMRAWSKETPSFFQPEKGTASQSDDSFFFDVPWTLKRQQRNIRIAYHFTYVLIYRNYLLNDLLHPPFNNIQSDSPRVEVQKCIEAALNMASFAAEIANDDTYNPVYWTTSYLTFCAISVLVVYLTLYPNDHQYHHIEQTIERAMQGHRKLDHSLNSYAQRVLEESRTIAREVQQSVSPATQISCVPRTDMVHTTGLIHRLPDRQEQNPDSQWHNSFQASSSDLLWQHNIDANALSIFGESLDYIMDVGFDTSLNRV